MIECKAFNCLQSLITNGYGMSVTILLTAIKYNSWKCVHVLLHSNIPINDKCIEEIVLYGNTPLLETFHKKGYKLSKN